jgi:hypothetical protein
MNELYKLLELSPGADKKQIRQAYRRLARKYHPDVNASVEAHQRFVEIQQAYERLLQLEEDPFYEFKEMFRKDESRKEEERIRQQEARLHRIREAQRRSAAIQARKDEIVRKNIKIATVFGLIFSFILLLDYHFLSKEINGSVITHMNRHQIQIMDMDVNDPTVYNITNTESLRWLARKGTQVEMEVSGLLNVVLSVNAINGRELVIPKEPLTVYSLLFLHYPMLLFGLIILKFKERLNNWLFISMGLVEVFGGFLSIVFYLAHSLG